MNVSAFNVMALLAVLFCSGGLFCWIKLKERVGRMVCSNYRCMKDDEELIGRIFKSMSLRRLVTLSTFVPVMFFNFFFVNFYTYFFNRRDFVDTKLTDVVKIAKDLLSHQLVVLAIDRSLIRSWVGDY